MSCKPALTPGVMEGNGAYNRHALLPAGGGNLALPFLEQAVRNISLNGEDQPILIADYGSSQGKNSLAPMRAATKGLRARLGPERPIFVAHVDQAANDFNTLFDVLHRDPDRYALDDPNVFPCAIGRTFYENVLPPESVHLGWSSYAAVWLSRIPALIPGHLFVMRSTDDVRAKFELQAAADWALFLSLRARELRPGGYLVVVLPARSENGQVGLEGLFDHANAALSELVHEGAVTADERERMVVPGYPRRNCELLAPFQRDGEFQKLRVEDCVLSALPDAAWVAYEQDGDKESLAGKHALFFRSVFIPSFVQALEGASDENRRRIFADRFETALKRRLAHEPAPIHSFVQTMVLVKQEPSGV